MIAVVQRVTRASVSVIDPPYKASIEGGLCVLLGIENEDDDQDAKWMANKLANLRIFCDENNKMNRSLLDNGGELLLISQFTLAGDCTQGNRPSFTQAAKPEIAEPLVAAVGELLHQDFGIRVMSGVFGAMMNVEITNNGPVTIVLKRD